DMPNLELLEVMGTRVTAQGILKIKNLRKLDLLRVASVKGSPIVHALVNSPRLRRLHLIGTDLTDADMKIVAAIPELEALTVQSNPRVTDTGISYLMRLRGLKRLTIVHLGNSSAILRKLAQWPLKELTIDTKHYDQADLGYFQKMRPDCRIVSD